ncbi:hypothetical protein [Sinorhizobium fredii]|uniref:hypothetical protein n=1 Tax=Rhizobium fredii TaxID=380 RepID=UPI001296743E|nr:hypothetical protein [Sinorhizobium fredii]MQW99588.1 hypothetical protein [Sinorhizobium fredii]
MKPSAYAFMALMSTASPVGTWAADIDFGQAFLNNADNSVVVETSPEDVLVFKEGLFDLKGKALTIIAPNIRVEGLSVIKSFDPEFRPPTKEGTPDQVGPGAGGGGWGCQPVDIQIGFGRIRINACERNGQQGPQGTEGARGTDGNAAAAIEIRTTLIDGPGKIVIIGNGQSGGKGQQGGQGGNGGRGQNGTNRGGDVFCGGARSPENGGRGGQGGTGGTGGLGGVGGLGAEIIISSSLKEITTAFEAIELEWLRTMNDEQKEKLSAQKLLVSAPGGLGGLGGDPGVAGNPGGGGDAGKGSHCGGGSDPGAPGAPGSPGTVGSGGPSGVPGAIRFE